MKYRTFTLLASSLLLLPISVHAAPQTPTGKVSMEACMDTALAKRPGQIVKLERKDERGVPVYEFEVLSSDGKTYELECDANSGKIIEEEQESSSIDDPSFKSKAKISLEEAKKIALKAIPGEIEEIEFEIEADGTPSYEFDIKTKDGKEMKIEISAVDGKIVEDKEVELYQIGKE